MNEKIEKLIHNFEGFLSDIEKNEGNSLGVTKVVYPTVVISLNQKEETAELAVKIKKQILRLLPAYRGSIPFFEMRKEENLQFSEIDVEKNLSEETMRERIAELYEENSYFKKFNKLLVFYVLDLTNAADKRDLDQCLEMIRECEQKFSFRENILFLAINEKFGNESQAADIRREYARLYFDEGTAAEIVPCTYLVSNQNTMGSVMPKGNGYFSKIFADTILLCDCEDAYVSDAMRSKGIKTVGFTTQEKPVNDIAKACITSMLTGMGRLRNSGEVIQHNQIEEKLAEKLNAISSILAPYLDSVARNLPTREMMQFFPRRTCEDMDLSTLSMKKLNEETYGAWDCYVSKIAEKIEETLEFELLQGGKFAEKIESYLRENFLREELIWFSQNLEVVRDGLEKKQIDADPGKSAVEMMKENIIDSVCKNERVKKIIIEEFDKVGKDAKRFQEYWKEIENPGSIIVEQADIIKFYDKKVRSYIEEHQERLKAEFQKIVTEDEMEKFLNREMKGMINSNPVFRIPFEEELIQRVNDREPEQALRLLTDKLSGNKVKIWIRSNGMVLNEPIQKVLLLQDNTSLYQSLKRVLDHGMYYYDTDLNESADALNVYEVRKEHILIGNA